MTTRRRSSRLVRQSAELALAAPLVVAQRLQRIAAAGATPSARDRREFERMGSEKVQAFNASWLAMWAEAWRVQQRWWTQALGAMWAPWWFAPPRLGRGAAQRATLSILGQGLAPVHRRAVANAKRLTASKRR